MILYLLLDVLIAYILDLILGDPYRMPHPVRFIGWMIRRTERFLRAYTNTVKTPGDINGKGKRERIAGTILTLFTVAVVFLIVFGILRLFAFISPILFHAANIYFIYSSLAARCLADEAKKVYDCLDKKDLDKARKRLSMLVGRQTEDLSEQEVIRGVVETTAENTVDGVISPLIYATIGSIFGLGAPVVYAFKAISTLDSMVGYMNEEYLNFGRTSAKTDDVLNFIPARISGLLIPVSAFFCSLDFKKSFTIMLRDRKNHKSPNCAYPEAAVAGALSVKLGGANVYFGRVMEKPTIGDSRVELHKEHIKKAVRLMYVTSFLTLSIMGLICFLLLQVK